MYFNVATNGFMPSAHNNSAAYLFIWFLIMAAMAIATVAGAWKTYEKAGIKGWKCIIPFYSSYLQYKIAFGNGWIFLTSLIPVAGFIIYILCMIRFAKAFGRGILFGIALVVIYPFAIVYLGFSRCRYIGDAYGI